MFAIAKTRLILVVDYTKVTLQKELQTEMKIKEVFLANRPEHAPTAADFGTREIDCPCALPDGGFSNESLPRGGLLVKLAWISVDPYMRNRMRPVGPSYAPAWEIGGTIDGFAVGQGGFQNYWTKLTFALSLALIVSRATVIPFWNRLELLL